MNVNVIRFLDRFIGAVICLILWPFKIKKKRLKKRKIKKVLIIKIWGIGSIINITPTISDIKSAFPNSNVYLLTMNHNKELYENNCEKISRVYSLNLENIFTAIGSISKTILQLRKEKIDVLIDFEIPSNSTAIINFFIKPKITIGYITNKTKDKLFDILVQYKEGKHITKIFKEVLKPLGVAEKKNRFIVPVVLKKDGECIDNILEKLNIKDYIVLNINVSATALERRMPIDKFMKIVEYILNKYKTDIILIGSIYDVGYVRRFQKNFPDNVYSFAGKTNLLQLFYLIKNSSLLITNDSGPLHLGFLGNTKTISFFGPETPIKYGPKGKRHIVIYNKLVCSPCMDIFNSKKINCKYNCKCMRNIPVEKIKKAIDSQLR